LIDKVALLESKIEEIEKMLEDHTVTIATIASLQVDIIKELKYVLDAVSPEQPKGSKVTRVFYPIDITGDDDLIN
jgi:hypothetical protein